MGQLADWKCHKVVKAGKILTMPQYGYIVTIEDCNQAECKVDMPADAFKRGRRPRHSKTAIRASRPPIINVNSTVPHR